MERGIYRENYGYLYLLKAYLKNRSSKTGVLGSSDAPVVALTTHSNRIQRVFVALESIASGSLKPSRLILFVSDAYRGKPLPATLRRLQMRGLEIRYCEDVGPHTKYYPYVDLERRFADPLVTADDDIIYPTYWLASLYSAWKSAPAFVHCFRAKTVVVEDEGLAPYREWKNCKTTKPSFRNFATGVSGAIYPPDFLRQLKKAGTAFLACCPAADDLWLHVNAVRGGWPVRQIASQPIHFPHVPFSRGTALFKGNVRQDRNDQQILDTYQQEDVARLRAEEWLPRVAGETAPGPRCGSISECEDALSSANDNGEDSRHLPEAVEQNTAG